MTDRYVDMEELEERFREYGIPYTNIFDELRTLSARDVADRLPVSELREALENKEDVFAMQLWTKEDIKSAIRAAGIFYSEELAGKVADSARRVLEDCSDGWEKLDGVVTDCALWRRKE